MNHSKTLYTETRLKHIAASNPLYSVFVSASAGTGKTKILIDRFLRLMLNGTKAEKILCITYTNTAAEEIKARLLKRLKSWQEREDNLLKQELKELTDEHASQETIDKARDLCSQFRLSYRKLKISTIHSFCNRMLASNMNFINKNTLVLPNERKQLLKKALSVMLRNEEMAAHYLFMLKYYDKLYLDNCLFDTFEVVSGHKFYFNSESWPNGNRDIEQLIAEFVDENCHLITSFFSLKNIQLDIKNNKKLSYELLCENLLTKTGSLRRNLKEEFNFLGLELEKTIELIKEVTTDKLNMAFFSLWYGLKNCYAALKTQHKKYDFEDIINNSLSIFEESNGMDWRLFGLDESIDHIMLDEAQDFSPLQWEIVKHISAEFFSGISARILDRTIFIVGDFKQSIYSFQGADPNQFLQARDFYRDRVQNAEGKWLEIELQLSFRCKQNVLDLVNKFCATSRILSVDHFAFREDAGEVVWHILPACKKKSDRNVHSWAFPFAQNKEADDADFILAQEIKGIVQKLAIENALDYSDIMILFSKRCEGYRRVIEELLACGIKVNANSKLNLNQNPVTNIIMILLRFVVYPYDDYNLFQLLTSPCMGLDDLYLRDLVRAKNAEKSGKSLLEFIEKNDTQISKNLFLQLEAAHLGVGEWFNIIMWGFGFANKLAMHFGSGYYSDIEWFNEYIALTCEQIASTNVIKFYNYVQDNPCFIDRPFLKQKDAVNILTIHAAKGMEAPVVILADSYKPYSYKAENVILFEEELMFIPSLTFRSNKVKRALDYIKKQDEAENLRLLYVALTRAIDKLFIITNDANNKLGIG